LTKKDQNNPVMSTLGVKMALNIVNIQKATPLFPL